MAKEVTFCRKINNILYEKELKHQRVEATANIAVYSTISGIARSAVHPNDIEI